MALAIKEKTTPTHHNHNAEARTPANQDIHVAESEEEILREGYVHYWLSHNNDLESIDS